MKTNLIQMTIYFLKTRKLYNILKVVKSVFNEDTKWYLQVFLDECFYKFQMFEYDRIDVSERTNVKKSNKSV